MFLKRIMSIYLISFPNAHLCHWKCRLICITKTLQHLGQQGPSSPFLCGLAAATEETWKGNQYELGVAQTNRLVDFSALPCRFMLEVD